MRIAALFTLGFAALTLAACGDSESDTAEDRAEVEAAAEEVADDGSGEGAEETISVDDTGATPMEERVATIGLLNKRNNVSKDFEITPGNSIEDGPVILTLAACERTRPEEFPQETGAFVQVDVLERGNSSHTRAFSGWLFKENPSLNVVEHPVYDVWVKDCAMSFPGEE